MYFLHTKSEGNFTLENFPRACKKTEQRMDTIQERVNKFLVYIFSGTKKKKKKNGERNCSDFALV